MEILNKKFGYCGHGLMTEGGFIKNNNNNCKVYLNKSTELLNIEFDKDKEEFILNYKEVVDIKEDTFDKYVFYYVNYGDFLSFSESELVNFTFYGKYYVSSREEYIYLFGKYDGIYEVV